MTNTQADWVKTFSDFTVPLLRARATSAGIAGRSKMNKTELIFALADFEVAQNAGADVPAELCSHGLKIGRKCSICTEDAAKAPRVAVHTAGELHPAPKMPAPDFVFNLSRLLDDPAHKPGTELIELDGLDSRVQDFVFATDGAWDLYADAVRLIERQIIQGKSVTVLVLCRGGKHRSVAFGDWLAAHFSVEATHHHKHLPRVTGDEDGVVQPPSFFEGQDLGSIRGGFVRADVIRTARQVYTAELKNRAENSERALSELRCAIAHLVGYWGVASKDQPYADALDSILSEHR